MPYDLPFLTTERRRLKREPNRTRTEEIAREQAFRDFISRNPEALPQTEAQFSASQELERMAALAAAPERKPDRFGSIGAFAKKAAGRAYERTGLKGTVEALDWFQRNVSEPIGATAETLGVPSFGRPVPGINLRGNGPVFGFTPQIPPWEPGWRESYQENVPWYDRLAYDVGLDPLNVIPGVGFTKLPRMARRTARFADEIVGPLPVSEATIPGRPDIPLVRGQGESPAARITRDIAAAPPPGQPPRVPPQGGVVTAAGGGQVLYPPADINIFNFQPIRVGLTTSEKIRNIARRTVGKPFAATELSDVATPAMNERKRVQAVIDSQGNSVSASIGAALRKVFQFDKQGGIPSLSGIDPSLPGYPTVADLAARLPAFEQKLTGEQLLALRQLERNLAPYKVIRDRLGIETGVRPDVMDGGFYVPRGRAELEGADEPFRVGLGRRQGKAGFEKPVVFRESQAQGIAANYLYAPVDEAVGSYIKDVGRRTLDEHLGNYFKSVTDDTGALLGETSKMRLLRQNPIIAAQKADLDRNLNRLKGLLSRLTERQQRVIDDFINNPTFDDIDALRQALVNVRAKSGPSVGASVRDTQQLLRDVKLDLKILAPDWKRSLEQARQTPRGQAMIDLSPLANRSYPMEIANAANAVLQSERPITGAIAPLLDTANALNNLYRGLHATLDDSAIGVQGLLGLASDQKAYARALPVNFRAWGPGGRDALGQFINHFNLRTQGRLSSVGWTKEGLRIGGQDTEFMLGRGVTSLLSKLPGVRQANRAFGYFGDTLRLGWADDLLKSELKKGRSLHEIISSGDGQRIAQVVNGATGWSTGKTFGNMGDLLLFAPRFLQSRLETVARGALGLRPGSTLEQREARNSILRLMGYGTLLTVAVNEMLGEETDWNPISNGRYNSNFMRIRFEGRDWSVFGTWDSLARMFVMSAQGKPHEAIRGMSSGIVSNAWDIITNEAFTGEPVRDTPQQFAERMMENFVPFAAEEIPSAVGQAKEGNVLAGGVTVAGEIFGVKSAPLSGQEATDLARQLEMERRNLTGPFNDLSPSLREQIDDVPDVAQAKSRWEERQRDRRSKWRLYNDEREAIDKKYDNLILELEKEGPGKQYRDALSKHQSDRALEKELLKGRSSEGLEFLEELEPRQGVVNQALDAYMRAVEDPLLDNASTKEYDFDERERRIDSLKQQFGPAIIKEVEDFIHRHETPLQKKLREDRATLKPYWETSERVKKLFPPSFAKYWDQYLSETDPVRQSELRRKYDIIISPMLESRDAMREHLRASSGKVDAALLKWGYGPTTFKSVEGLKQYIEQTRPRKSVGVP